MTLGERLKEARLSAGMKQEELAAQLGVSRQTISNWENDRSMPDVGIAVKLGKLYNTSLDSLLSGEEVIRHFEDLAAKRRKFWQRVLEAGLLVELLGIFLAGQGYDWLGIGVFAPGFIAVYVALAMHLKVFVHSRGEIIRGYLALTINITMLLAQLLGILPEGIWWDLAYAFIQLGTSILLLSAGVCTFDWLGKRMLPIFAIYFGLRLLMAGNAAQDQGLLIGNNPFFREFRVEVVLYPENGQQHENAWIDLPDEERMYIAWDGVNKEAIGTFTYTPPSEGDTAKGIWVLTPEENPTAQYRMVLAENGDLLLSYSEQEQLQWKWKLKEDPYTARITLENLYYTEEQHLVWYPDGMADPEPRSTTDVPGTAKLTIHVENPEEERLTVVEEYHDAGQVEQETYTLSPNKWGAFEMELTTRYDGKEEYALYRIPYDGGEYRFCLTYGAGQ